MRRPPIWPLATLALLLACPSPDPEPAIRDPSPGEPATTPRTPAPPGEAPATPGPPAAPADPRTPTPDAARFEERYAALAARLASTEVGRWSDERYTELPEFADIVAMGKRALPAVMDKVAAGDVRMNAAARAITGVDVLAPLRDRADLKRWGPGRPPFGATDTSRLWLEWWAAHRDDPQWQP